MLMKLAQTFSITFFSPRGKTLPETCSGSSEGEGVVISLIPAPIQPSCLT